MVEPAKFTKNGDADHYSYCGYGIGFDSSSSFSFPSFDWSKNNIIFGVDNSSSVHIQCILIIGKKYILCFKWSFNRRIR